MGWYFDVVKTWNERVT